MKFGMESFLRDSTIANSGWGRNGKCTMNTAWDIVYLSVATTVLRTLVARASSDKWLILWPGIVGVAEQYYLFLQQGPSHGVNVLAIDPPGHGFSQPWDGELTENDVSLVWRTLLEQFDISDATLGGHSYGGYCALMGNTIELTSVKKAVLFDAGYEPARDSLELLRKGMRDHIDNTVFESWQQYLDEERKYASYWDDDLANALPSDANEQRARDIENLSKRLKGLTALPVPNAGHSVISNNRHFVTQAVWAFMDTNISVLCEGRLDVDCL
jgi:pimeloyl-ACP methyl ester carboxylesterase